MSMKNDIYTISVFGDSILKGIVTGTESGRMYDIIKENALSLASKELGFNLKNYSIFGNIITRGLKTLSFQLKKGLESDAVIIESGGNDCNVNWVEIAKNPELKPTEQVSVSDYKKTINEMIDLIRSNKMTPILASPLDFVSERWFEQLCINGERKKILEYYDGNVQNLSKKNNEYYKAMKECAKEKNVHFIDTRIAMSNLKNVEDFMCQDGIHPNAKGHEFLSKVFIKELAELEKM